MVFLPNLKVRQFLHIKAIVSQVCFNFKLSHTSPLNKPGFVLYLSMIINIDFMYFLLVNQNCIFSQLDDKVIYEIEQSKGCVLIIVIKSCIKCNNKKVTEACVNREFRSVLLIFYSIKNRNNSQSKVMLFRSIWSKTTDKMINKYGYHCHLFMF